MLKKLSTSLAQFAPLAVLFFISMIILQGCAAIFVASAAGGAMVATDRRTAGVLIEDQNIELKFTTRLTENIELDDNSHINAVSYNNILLLVGQTPQQDYKNQIGDLARKVPSVKRVHNEIRISAPNSMMTRSSDSYITTKIKTSMTLEKNFSSGAIKVITEDGEVFLMGLVSAHEAKIATTIAKNTDGVKKVIDVFEYISD